MHDGRTHIAWHGDFLGEGSLARVNRHLVRALRARGAVEVLPCGEPVPAVELVLGMTPGRREDGAPPTGRVVTLRHRWPPHFMRPPTGWYVHLQAWELGALPVGWIAPLRERADAVWCYSTYVRDMYVAAGLEPARVSVLPLGFDPTVYHPGVEPLPVSNPTTCIFLFVGGFAVRKNVAGAIAAFTRAFRAGEDDVALLIKDNPELGAYDPRGAAGLRELAERTDIPPVRFLEAQYSDADMARLYRMAAALVHPYRGEGFGLPVLEAMACGTPVIVSHGGSTDDFVDEHVGYPVSAHRVAVGTAVDGFALHGTGWWLDPDPAELAAAMRRVYEHRDDARARGARAATRAHAAWTWRHSAEHVDARLASLFARAPLSAPAESIEDYGGDALYELFSRLRVTQPCYAAADENTPAARAARRWGWERVDPAAVPHRALDLFDCTGAPECIAPPGTRVLADGDALIAGNDLLVTAGFRRRGGKSDP